MEEITMSTSTSLTERVRNAREWRGFTEDQLRYDPLLRSMIEHVARSEERAATEDELAAAFADVGAQHGLRTSTASGARSRGSWRGGGIRCISGTGAAAEDPPAPPSEPGVCRPVVIRKILTHLRLPTKVPAPRPAPSDLFGWS
jgi:hypothetical protein